MRYAIFTIMRSLSSLSKISGPVAPAKTHTIRTPTAGGIGKKPASIPDNKTNAMDSGDDLQSTVVKCGAAIQAGRIIAQYGLAIGRMSPEYRGRTTSILFANSAVRLSLPYVFGHSTS